MKVFFIFCLMTSSFLINNAESSPNLKSENDTQQCYSTLQEEAYLRGYISMHILESQIFKDIHYLDDNLTFELHYLVEERYSSDFLCKDVIDPCKDNLKSYISNFDNLFSSVLDFDFSKIQKNLDSLYDDCDNMEKNKCDLRPEFSSNKQILQTLDDKNSKFSNLISQNFKLNDDDSCQESLYYLHSYIKFENRLFISGDMISANKEDCKATLEVRSI